jgi:hypothetical protein
MTKSKEAAFKEKLNKKCGDTEAKERDYQSEKTIGLPPAYSVDFAV